MARIDSKDHSNIVDYDRSKHFMNTTVSYWEDIDDCWTHVINCEQHLDILKECEVYKNWEQLYRPKLEQTTRVAWKDNTSYSGKWVAFPDYDSFPIFMEWFDKHKEVHGWFKPEIRKLDAGKMIQPHSHDNTKEHKYLYNMSINHPEGCMFGIKPAGQVPYKDGDVYKIKVHNEHCVWNKSNSDRYHAILGYTWE